jgi:hypothetical protein
MNIYEKLQEARIRLQEMNLRKSGKNKFAGFSYYELADFIPAVNKIFGDLKLYSMFLVEADRAILSIVNAEAPEEHVVFTSPTASVDLKGCTAIQAIGAVHTYMKRYLYLNALEIVEHDALDAQVGKPNPIDYDKAIENVKDVKQLNNTYKFLIDNARDDSWKPLLMDKSAMLNARFNQEAKVFERASA